MIKKINKIFIYLTFILALVIFYLSIFGITTNRFNNLINNQINNYNKNINIKFKDPSFIINLVNFSLKIEIKNPIVNFNNRKLNLDKIKLNIKLKSLIFDENPIDNLKIKSKENRIINYIKLYRTFQDSIGIVILENYIYSGEAQLNIKLNFNNNGNLKKDFEINGNVKNLKIIKSFNKIVNNSNFDFSFYKNKLEVENGTLELNKFILGTNKLNITNDENNDYLISGNIFNQTQKINLSLFEILSKEAIFNLNKVATGKFSTNFNLLVSKKLKIKKFDSITDLKLKNSRIKISNEKINELFSKQFIDLNDHEIKITYNTTNKIDNNFLLISGKGFYKLDKDLDKIKYSIKKKNKSIYVDANIELNNKEFNINKINFVKERNSPADIKTKFVYNKNKNTHFSEIIFKNNKNTIIAKDLKINSKYEITDLDSLTLNFRDQKNLLNKVNIKKNKSTYLINGDNFDISNIYGDINKNSETKDYFSKKFNSNFQINIKKLYMQNDIYLSNVVGSAKFKNNTIKKAKIEAKLEKDKTFNLFLNTTTSGEKITTVTTNYPKPFIQKYDFVKGFSDGVLDYQSIQKNDISYSTLLIDNFKVNEVPVLAKILTLASLQGIADLLTGEGIRFTDFEMKYEKNKSLTTIEEIFAIGPAISVLMSGYIEQDKIVSLRGTLVPATTINKTISNIPVLGNILVGEKAGEGVFGVSFKIKGHPNKLKTTVNPIKTLTPRFITRTLKNIKN
ncbi:hypothetical protein OAY95_01135 [Candidatus Pelagibacter sp.]|nr:hypothetical protein [Candidatus Pelagibacter sp.]